MTIKINADTSDGLKFVSDTSGVVDIQSNGVNACSVALNSVTIGSGAAADTKIVFDGNAQDYHIGLDDSNDSLTIGKGSTLGTTTSVVIDANGIITTPLQPAFSVNAAGEQSNCTGNGAAATVAFGTEHIDRNGDFASNTFTAPVTGLYFMNTTVTVKNFSTSNTTGRLHIASSNRSFLYEFDPAENIGGAGAGSFAVSGLVDMDAADTATVTMQIFDSSLSVDIQASGTNFQGYLIG